MLIAILNYVKPLTVVDAHRPAHLAHLKALLAAGKLIIAGRQNPPSGGVIIVKGLTKDEMHQIMAQDPYIIEGIAEYHLIEFMPSLLDETLREACTHV